MSAWWWADDESEWLCCEFVLGHKQHSCEVSWPAVQNNPIKVRPIEHTQLQESVHWCPTGQAIVLSDSRVAVLLYLRYGEEV